MFSISKFKFIVSHPSSKCRFPLLETIQLKQININEAIYYTADAVLRNI